MTNHSKPSESSAPDTITPLEEGGYAHDPTKVEGHVTRAGRKSIDDLYSQSKIFWNSLIAVEKEHTIEGFSYQLGKVKSESVRQPKSKFG